MPNPIEILGKGCNLFRRGTHAIVPDEFSGLIYVSRKDVALQKNDKFKAAFIAQVDFDDPKGCAKCSVYNFCLPTPCILPIGEILRAAQQTSFTTDDIPGELEDS